MTAPEVPAVVIPDGIEPVEAYRCWNLDMRVLRSLNGEVWTPGEPLTAKCHCGNNILYTWAVERRAVMAYEDAVAIAERYYSVPAPPSLSLPTGYGLRLKSTPVEHLAPREGCTCGIYAASTQAGVPSGGDVYGKVKLWGQVVPGEKGVRAQYAYPSEFHVPAALADDPTLLAFGVPIIVVEDAAPQDDFLSLAMAPPGFRGRRRGPSQRAILVR